MQTFSFGQMINPVSPFLFRFRDLEQSTELALIRTPGAGTMCLSERDSSYRESTKRSREDRD